jgi:coatomer subunit beta
MLRLGTSGKVPIEMDRDSKARLELCFHVIGHPEEADTDVWLKSCGQSFALMIEEKLRRESQASANSDAAPVAQADDLIDFHHLKSRKGMTQLEIEDAVATDLARATGFMDSVKKNGRSLDRVMQLTGLSDTVYAETYVTVHQYDITLDVTMINRTDEPLQNVMLELSTMGDLKLVERPQPFSLPPFGSHNLRASIKVSSTETGVIFGNIVYETARSDRNVIVLNDVHIDIMDYIIPATCSDTAFRSMWAEFEWENKVAVSTNITDVRKYLDHIVTSTNMKCLTPPSALDGECGFLAANLYAKSVFGEDALVNVSIESNDGEISGFIRIRSKTQGIALSLGDKITLKQSIEI